MTFALPIALTLAALALPIIALYILKVRLRRVPVSTNLFWKQIYEEKPPRSIWQHFRNLMSLLLQLLMLLLLVLAIADPYFSWQLLQARRVVIVIDNSASMSSADVSPSRFEAARTAARNIVEGLRVRDEMAIIVAGSTPEVAIGMTGHAPSLRAAIDKIVISDNPTNLRDAIELGRKLVGQHTHGQIVVLTDGAADASQMVEPLAADVAGDEAKSVSRDTKPTLVDYRLFTTEANNVGITQLQGRRSLIDPLGYEILASVLNASTQPVACRLELTLDDIPIDVIPLNLKPDEHWTRSFEKTSLEGGRIKAQLTQIAAGDAADSASNPIDSANKANGGELDMLATDNTAWAILPERQTQRVLIVSSGNLFLQKVFEANPLVEVTMRKDLPAAGDWPTDSLIVLHGAVPATLPSGNVFVVDPTGSCDQWDLSDPIENPIVTDQDTTSLLMNHIRLDNVLVPEVKQLNFKSPIHALAKTLNGEVIYSDVKRPNGKCLVLSINLDRSDLAFRTAFPILVANALNWFAGTSGELQPAIASGSVTTVRLDAAALNSHPPQLFSPSGKLFPIAVSAVEDSTPHIENADASDSNETKTAIQIETAAADRQTVTIGPLNEVGVWTIVNNLTTDESQNKPTSEAIRADVPAEVAVNLASERETDLRPLEQLTESTRSTAVTSSWFSRPLWFYLTCVAILLTCVEWFLYQRRFIS